MGCNTVEIIDRIEKMLEEEKDVYSRKYPKGFKFVRPEEIMEKYNEGIDGYNEAWNMIRNYGNERESRGRVKMLEYLLYELTRK